MNNLNYGYSTYLRLKGEVLATKLSDKKIEPTLQFNVLIKKSTKIDIYSYIPTNIILSS
jgi:hypothetical protein